MKGRKGTKVKNKKVIVLSVLGVFVAFIAAGVFGVVTLCNSWLEDLPDYQNADAYNTAQPTMVYASDGTTLLAEFQLENRDPVALDQISEYVLKGTVATEDERFYTHSGVDYLGVARALVNNLMGGELEGASTITQQFVRNTILSDEMRDISFKRKIREMYISQKLEEQYSKDEILLMYLNTINYGSGAYGIEAAAERYFSKDAKDLTLNEAATLVGIPQSPTYNNPIDYPDNCLKRRNTVLDRMVSNGVITAEEADAVKAEPIELNPSEPSMTGILAYPYFTSYVRNQLTNPEGKYAYSTSELFKGGLKVITTLDIEAQTAAEEAAAEKEEEAGDPFEVAMAVVNPENGYIDALVGGRDYESSQVNMATGEGGAGRQAGSSFKLFTLLAAINEGIDPETLPAVLPTGACAGTLTQEAASALGLPQSVKVVIGAHDQIVNALGCGVANPGEAVDTTGTVECICPLFASIPETLDFERENYACVPYLDGRGYVTYAYNISGGAVVRWYRDSLAFYLKQAAKERGCSVYDLLNETCPPEPTGLIVLPFLQGMGGTPDVLTGARGTIYGLTMHTSPADLYRAILEGLTFEMRYNLEKLAKYDIRPTTLFAAGGGAKSPVWRQIKADILGAEIRPTLADEAGALGSAILGLAAATGEKDRTALAARFVRYGQTAKPDAQRHAYYEKQFALYKELRDFEVRHARG